MNTVSATAAACMLLAARGVDPANITPLAIHHAIDVVYRVEQEITERENGKFKVPEASPVSSNTSTTRQL